MTEQEMTKQISDRERQRQLEEEMAKEEADVLDSQEKIHTLGDSIEQTTVLTGVTLMVRFLANTR